LGLGITSTPRQKERYNVRSSWFPAYRDTLKMSHESFLITDVRIFNGETFIEKGYVLVRDGKISQVGAGSPPSESTDLPVLSKPDHTLLPGLIDAHIHSDKGNIASLEQSLRFGVTTVCDMHNELVNVEKLKKVRPGTLAKSWSIDRDTLAISERLLCASM